MFSIAMDGPAGAGKSSLAKSVAATLGFIYVDTGALYRALGLKALQNSVAIEAGEPLEKMLAATKLDLAFRDGEQRVLMDGVDLGDSIRTPEVSMAASRISAIPCVRAFLLEMQREMARRHDVIMDGRDIGTVVLPDASLKIFITASPEARAERRYKELIQKGKTVTLEEVFNDMVERDRDDSTRAIAPLVPAADAVLVDTTELSIAESRNALLNLIRERLGL